MSTTNLSTALGNEIAMLIMEDVNDNHSIIEKKIRQLSRLNISLTFFYFSCCTLVLAGLVSGIYAENKISGPLLYLSITAIFCALILLIVYSTHAVNIKRHQFKRKL